MISKKTTVYQSSHKVNVSNYRQTYTIKNSKKKPHRVLSAKESPNMNRDDMKATFKRIVEDKKRYD